MQIIEKPILSLAILITVTSVIAYSVNVYFRSSDPKSTLVSNQEVFGEETKESLLKKLEIEVINLNSDLPKKIDEDTQADSISVESGPKLITRYTYTSFSSDEFDSDLFDKKVRKVLKKSLCKNNEVLARMELGLIYSYEFSGNDGIMLATAEFNAKDCE